MQHLDVSVTLRAHLALVVFAMVEPPAFETQVLETCPVFAILDMQVSENGIREEPYSRKFPERQLAILRIGRDTRRTWTRSFHHACRFRVFDDGSESLFDDSTNRIKHDRVTSS